MRKFNKKRLIITSIFLSLFVVGTLLIFTVPTSVKITYNLTTETKDGVTISFNVFEPKVTTEKKMKAVIIGHGVIVNKEMLKGYGIDIAAAGFVVVTFDFRGHGLSSGELNIEDLPNDVKAIKEYLKSRGDIDTNSLGYIGYSMGGFPGNEIVKDDEDYKCFIGIGTGLDIEKDDISENRTLNILMILGKYDEAFKLKDLKKQMGKLIDKDADDVVVNRLYGGFEDGNAAKIFVDDNADHLTTAWDQDFVREARDWIMDTFSDVRPVDSNFYVNVRALILIVQVIGGIGFFFLMIEPLSSGITKKQKEAPHKIEIPGESLKSISKKTIIYSFILGIPGMAILLFTLVLFLPLTLAGGLTMFLFGQAFAILFLLKKLGKKANKSLIEILKEPFKDSKENIVRQIILGTILAIILYLILYLSFGLNYLGMAPSIYKIPWIPIYFAITMFLFLVFSLLFLVIMPHNLDAGFKGLFKTVGIDFTLLMIYACTFILVPCILMGNYFLVMVLVLMAPILLLAVFNSAILYQKTGNIIAAAIVNTLFIICLNVTLSPFFFVINGFSTFSMVLE